MPTLRLLLLAALLLLARTSLAIDAGPLNDAVDKQVDIVLQSGDQHQGATLLKVNSLKRTGEARSVRVILADGDKRTLALRKIKSIKLGEELLFEADTDTTPSRRMSPAERRAAKKAAAEKQAAEEHEKWLGRLRARGVRPWKDATDAQHQAAIDKHKQTGEQVQQMFPDVRLYETEQFLFFSNIPPGQVGPFIKRLDNMHTWMMKTYGLPEDARVWLGKAPVFAFMEQQQFAAFEERFYKMKPRTGTYGLCHQSSTGEVVIACYRGQQPVEFGQMLVHETSHGFIHRYKAIKSLPSWVNEGMADYIGELMVPASKTVKTREKQIAKRLKQQPVIRAGFFGEGKIQFDEYGLASSITRFMLRNNPDAYVEFIEKLKEGMPWEEALSEAYQAKPEELLAAYGRWIGAPGLQVR